MEVSCLSRQYSPWSTWICWFHWREMVVNERCLKFQASQLNPADPHCVCEADLRYLSYNSITDRGSSPTPFWELSGRLSTQVIILVNLKGQATWAGLFSLSVVGNSSEQQVHRRSQKWLITGMNRVQRRTRPTQINTTCIPVQQAEVNNTVFQRLKWCWLPASGVRKRFTWLLKWELWRFKCGLGSFVMF